jgi:hypothetical protein
MENILHTYRKPSLLTSFPWLNWPKLPENTNLYHIHGKYSPYEQKTQRPWDLLKLQPYIISMVKEVMAQETTMRSMQFHISLRKDPGCSTSPYRMI